MRISAVLAREYPGVTTSGGAGTMMRDLLESLQEFDWETSVCLYGRGEPTEINSVNIHFGHDVKADIIISHLGGWPKAKRLGEELGIPVVLLVHNTSEATVGCIAQRPEMIVFNSYWVQNYHKIRSFAQTKRTSGSPPPDVIIRPPALDYPVSQWDRDGAFTLINLVQNKGPDLFYDLARAFPNEHFIGVQGGYERDKQVIKHLPNVEILPYQESLRSVYLRTKVLLIPSKYESYSLVAVEGMSYGIPILAAQTPGLQECLGRGIPTYSRNDFASWCTAIEEGIGISDSLASLERSKELFSQTKEDIKLLDSSLRSLIHDHNSAG